MDNEKRRIIILTALGTALVLAAGCALFYLWWNGNQAQQAASDLLKEVLTEDPVEEEDQTVSYILQIPSINLNLPVIWEFSEEALETSVCRWTGPDPEESGNLIIAGHDYLSGAHFGQLDQVEKGDTVTLFGRNEKFYNYTVTGTAIITPDEVEALNNFSDGHALTLMTCADNGNTRLLVYCAPAG